MPFVKLLSSGNYIRCSIFVFSFILMIVLQNIIPILQMEMLTVK